MHSDKTHTLVFVYLYFFHPTQLGSNMVSGAENVVPSVEDKLAALQLGNFAKATSTALDQLHEVAQKVQYENGLKDKLLIMALFLGSESLWTT